MALTLFFGNSTSEITIPDSFQSFLMVERIYKLCAGGLTWNPSWPVWLWNRNFLIFHVLQMTVGTAEMY